MWPSAVCCKFTGAVDFQHAVKIPAPDPLDMGLPSLHIVLATLLASAGFNWRQVPNGFPKRGSVARARSSPQHRTEVVRQIKTRPNKELPPSLLWQAEFHAILNLRMNAVAKCPRLHLNSSEILPTRRRADAQHVLNDEDLGL